jgi:putative addiction module component (TIGR02574 family)
VHHRGRLRGGSGDDCPRAEFSDGLAGKGGSGGLGRRGESDANDPPPLLEAGSGVLLNAAFRHHYCLTRSSMVGYNFESELRTWNGEAMSPAAEGILSNALTLPDGEQRDLIEALLLAGEFPTPQPVGEEWLEELNRRSDELDAGHAKLSKWSDVRERVRKKMAER